MPNFEVGLFQPSFLFTTHMLSFIWQKKLMKKLTRVQKDGRVDFDFGGSTEMAEDLFGPEAPGGPADEYMESEEDENWQPIPLSRLSC